MHILFVHQNFPAQFGHIADHLTRTRGWACTFVTQASDGQAGGIRVVHYEPRGGATQGTHFCSRTFENAVWHAAGVYEALKSRPEIRPDLIVGHSGFGSTLFLRDLYPEAPIVNLFEYYYRPRDVESDMTFRRDLPWATPEEHFLRARARNAMILLDLQNCDLGYCPTRFQLSRFPGEYLPKLSVVFDGVTRQVYHGHGEALRPPLGQRGTRVFAGVSVPPETRLVTYVSRGFESMRGFDIFMKAADLIARRRSDVHFIVVGTERVAYGGDLNHTGGQSFKDWVLAQQAFDLSRFSFVGRIPPAELGRLLAGTDLHIYLTAPFVLSWSMMDAMSCGAVVLGSDTAPVTEMIADGRNGLLADFFSPEEIADKAIEVLRDPAEFRPLGRAAEEMIVRQYSLEAVMPRMLDLYDAALKREPAAPARAPRSPFRG